MPGAGRRIVIEFVGKDKVGRSVAAVNAEMAALNNHVDSSGGKLGYLSRKFDELGVATSNLLENIPLIGPLVGMGPGGAAAALALFAGAAAWATETALSLGVALGGMTLGLGAVVAAFSGIGKAIHDKAAFKELTKQGQDFVTFLKQRMIPAWHHFRDVAQRNILPGIQKGLEGLAKLAKPFEATWRAVTKSVGRMFQHLGQALGKDNAIRKFLDNIRKDAPSIFRHLGHIIKNLTDIFVNLFNAFDPGKHGGFLKTLDELTRKIAKFTSNKKKMYEFVVAVKTLADGFRGLLHVIGWVVKQVARVIAKLVRDFRGVVKEISGAWDSVKANTTSAWDSIKSKVSGAWQAIVSTVQRWIGVLLGKVRGIPGDIRGALGNLGGVLVGAGKSLIEGLWNGIQSMLGWLGGKLGGIASFIADHKGPIEKDRLILKPAGKAIMEGLIDGIEQHRATLGRVLGRLTSFIKASNDRIKSLAQARQSIIQGFTGSTSSVFAEDLTRTNMIGHTVGPTAGSLLAFQRSERDKARRLEHDVRKLRRMGASDTLLRQMAAQGEAGAMNIHALARGSQAQVHALNRLNAQTHAALTGAGTTVGNVLFNDRIHQEKQDIRVAKHIEKALDRWQKHHDKHTIVELRIDGKVLRTSLLQLKRHNGGKALGLS